MSETLAYILGWKAAIDNKGLADNPLPSGTKEWQAWRDGWFDQDDEAELCIGATVAAAVT